METATAGECRFTTGGYFCPVCESKYCELPIECKVCGLTLVIAPHLARSYHHLFPLAPYAEIRTDSSSSSGGGVDLDENFAPVARAAREYVF